MQRDYYYPDLADRNPPHIWAEKGASDLWQRAGAKAQDILASPHEPLIDDVTDQQLRDKYNILLPRSNS